jgi:hypothetical protein
LEHGKEAIALEQGKETIALVRERLSVEKTKARWSAAAVIVPLVVAMLTVWQVVWTLGRQARANFELRAMELVMQSPTREDAVARAVGFRALFPQHLSPNFESVAKYWVPNQEPKKEFIKLLAARGLTKREMLAVWKQVFPGDEWAQNVSLPSAAEGVVQKSPVPSRTVQKRSDQR